jgi:hypothetical protein
MGTIQHFIYGGILAKHKRAQRGYQGLRGERDIW